jgi:hypothetical protein
MSTVKAVNFQHPSATQSNLVLAADGTVSGGLPSANRNLLYNGAMQVAQRGTSVTALTGDTLATVDRWRHGLYYGIWTATVENDAPTGSGLRKSAKLLCTTAKSTLAAGDLLAFYQVLEGQDVQRIAKGTASAQQLTLSFWVKANVTGTYIAELSDLDNTRRVSSSYTISASATWEKKTITFPADTTGVFDNDNGGSLALQFWLGAGSHYTSGSPLQTTWGTVTNTRATGQVNVAAAINNYWQVTGVQLEVGPVATSFEFKSYGQELRECQRYYIRMTGSTAFSSFGSGTAGSTTSVSVHVGLPTSMRTSPSSVATLNVGVGDANSPPLVPSAVTIPHSSPETALLHVAVTGAVQFRPYLLLATNNVNNYLAISAEL